MNNMVFTHWSRNGAHKTERWSSCKKMNLKTKPRVYNEFCVWLEKMLKEMIGSRKKAFGEESLSNSSIKKSLIENFWQQYKLSSTICPSPNFIKLSNGQNVHRNAFWVEVTILRKIEAKIKTLVVIANTILTFFIFLLRTTTIVHCVKQCERICDMSRYSSMMQCNS